MPLYQQAVSMYVVIQRRSSLSATTKFGLHAQSALQWKPDIMKYQRNSKSVCYSGGFPIDFTFIELKNVVRYTQMRGSRHIGARDSTIYQTTGMLFRLISSTVINNYVPDIIRYVFLFGLVHIALGSEPFGPRNTRSITFLFR